VRTDSVAELRQTITDLQSRNALLQAHVQALQIQNDQLRDELAALRRGTMEKSMYEGSG
jgi:hypothetical protein